MSQFEKFEVTLVSRKQLHGAPYNPRVITPEAKRRLRETIERVGLLGPITVNRLTWNVVGGHQRLAILDALEGTDTYSLDVALVDLSEQEEREQNLFLNNEQAQGSWDLPMLRQVMTDVNFDHAGFTAPELKELLAVPKLEEALTPEAVQATRVEQAAEEVQQQAAATTRRRKPKNAITQMLVVFESRPILEKFLVKLGMDSATKYIQAERLIMALRDVRGIKTEEKVPASEDSPF